MTTAVPEKTSPHRSALKFFTVLDALFRNFADGYAPGELARATGLGPWDITRIVTTLEEVGYAERIAETGRIRVSTAVARKALQVMHSLDAAERRTIETRQRLLIID